MFGIVVNENGFVVDVCVDLDDNNNPLNYTLKENESIIQFGTNNPITAFIKAKWNGTEWIEGATEEEIEEWKEQNKPKPIQPSEQDKVNASLMLEIAKLKAKVGTV